MVSLKGIYDYTDAHKMELELLKTKQFYEKILHNIPADIVAFDKNHKYIFINQNSVSDPIVREWLLGKDDFDYVKIRNKDITIAEKRRAVFNNAIAERKPKEFIEKLEDKQQNVRYLLRKMHPIVDHNNKIDIVIGYGIDVSSIRNAEKVILQKEKNIEQVANLLSMVMIVIDQDHNIIFTNAAYESLFGYPAHDIIGKNLNSINNHELDFIIKDFDLYRSSQQIDSSQKKHQFVDKYGFTKHITYSFTPYVRTDVNELNFAVFINDVSDQYFAVSELQKIVDKERRLNELKSGFVNVVSHELRTPLSVIQSSAEIMEILNSNDKITKEDIALHVNRIINEIDGMHSLMEELLLVSKIESGKVEFKPYPQNLASFVKVLIDDLYAPNNELAIALEVKGHIRETTFDRMMMYHILKNLLGNAIKYSVGKKIPRIRIRYTNGAVLIIIADYGIGIPAKDTQKLFKAFARASNTNGIKGTGLGLLIVKYFIDFHKAEINFKSKVNKGTCMLLEIKDKHFTHAKNSIDRR